MSVGVFFIIVGRLLSFVVVVYYNFGSTYDQDDGPSHNRHTCICSMKCL